MKTPPPVQPEKDWQPIELPFLIASGRTLASGIANEGRLRLRLFHRTSDNHLVGKIWFGDGADGPPHHAHGGASAYILDEAMGSCGWANCYPVVAAKLEYEFLQMVPLYEDHFIDTWVDGIVNKNVVIKSKLVLTNGQTAVASTGHFHILSQKQFKSLLKNVSPEILAKQKQALSRPYKWAPDDAS